MLWGLYETHFPSLPPAGTRPFMAGPVNTRVTHWYLDLERTFDRHFKELSARDPDSFKSEHAQQALAQLKKSAQQPNTQMSLTFSPTTMTSQQPFTRISTEMPYQEISGNSGQVIIDAVDGTVSDLPPAGAFSQPRWFYFTRVEATN